MDLGELVNNRKSTAIFLKSIIFTVLHFTALNCISLKLMLHQYYALKPYVHLCCIIHSFYIL